LNTAKLTASFSERCTKADCKLTIPRIKVKDHQSKYRTLGTDLIDT